MSSFVYHKKYFVEAAGALAGLAALQNVYREPLLWMYNHEAGRLFNDEDFYNTFVCLFQINAESVMLQYNDPEPETDTNEYRDIFQAAKAYVKKADLAFHCNGNREIILLLYRLSDFFQGVMYQIEEPTREQAAGHILNNIRGKFIEILRQYSGINRDDVSGWSGIHAVVKENA